jgi:hypothetical protein
MYFRKRCMKKLFLLSLLLTFSISLFGQNSTREKLTLKVLLLNYNPFIESENKTLIQVLNWHDPDSLAKICIQDLKECSSGYINYVISERIEVDDFPVKMDGFKYNDSTFLKCWRKKKNFHQPDGIDYHAIIKKYDILNKVKNKEIDEVWLFSFPYAGCWESIMVGKDAFFCNSDPITDIDAGRKFVIMGFNYERGVGEMLEDFGHRFESLMIKVFGGWEVNEKNDWNKFTLYDKEAPGNAQCGNVHFAPNSIKDYDWANKTIVESCCDDWLYYPNLKGIKKKVDCKEWGCEIRSHHKWWFTRLPKASGKKDGKLNNWWKYTFDYDNAIKE